MATSNSTDAVSIPLSAGDWQVVPAQSKLGFRTRVLGLLPVRGSYSGFVGELHVDTAGSARGVLRVDAETISTGIKKRDAHLRTTDFFAVEKHPHMTFELTSLVPGSDGVVTMTGTLNIRDRALPINVPVTVVKAGSDGLRIDGDFEVDHRASGFEFKRLPRTVRVQAALSLEPTS